MGRWDVRGTQTTNASSSSPSLSLSVDYAYTETRWWKHKTQLCVMNDGGENCAKITLEHHQNSWRAWRAISKSFWGNFLVWLHFLSDGWKDQRSVIERRTRRERFSILICIHRYLQRRLRNWNVVVKTVCISDGGKCHQRWRALENSSCKLASLWCRKVMMNLMSSGWDFEVLWI